MAEKNSAQTNRQTDRHYENNGHLAVNQLCQKIKNNMLVLSRVWASCTCCSCRQVHLSVMQTVLFSSVFYC